MISGSFKQTFLLVTLYCIKVHFGSYTPFPLREFLMGSDIAEQVHDYTCGPQLKASTDCCQCVESCIKYRTCCVDYYWHTQNFTNITKYRTHLEKITNVDTLEQCETVFPFATVEGFVETKYFMVSKCTTSSREEDLDLCKDGSFIKPSIPVESNNGVIYKNENCARCNNVKQFRMVKASMQCKKKSLIIDTCRLMLASTKNSVRCSMLSTCTKRNNTYYKLCHAFYGPIFGYSNAFCYLCDEGSNSVFFDDDRVSCMNPNHGQDKWSSHLEYSNVKEDKCHLFTVDQIFKEKCYSFDCPDGYYLVNASCRKTPIEIGPLSINSSRSLDINRRQFDTCLLKRKPGLFAVNIGHNLNIFRTLFGIISDKNDTSKTFYRFNSTKVSIDMITSMVDGEILKRIFTKPHEIILKLHEGEKIIIGTIQSLQGFEYELNLSHVFPKNRLCARPIPLKSDVTFLHTCDVVHDKNKISQSNLTFWIELENETISRHVYTCGQFYLDLTSCRSRTLSSNMTIDENLTLVHFKKDTQEAFNVDQYAPLKSGKYVVCDTILNSKQNLVATGVDLTAIIAAIISSLCYCFLFFTFLLFEELRNITGLCMMSICLCLFVADGLYFVVHFVHLIGFSFNKVLCAIIGGVIHYSMLCVHIWVTIIAHDVIKSVQSSSLLDISPYPPIQSEFEKYCFLTYITSFIIVLLTVSFGATNTLDVRYVKENMCVVNGTYGYILFYIMPLIITFIMAFVILTLSVKRLNDHIRRHREILENEIWYSDYPKIALKIIVLCGVSESIGFFEIPGQVMGVVFEMMHTIVLGSRGLLVMGLYWRVVSALYAKRSGTVKRERIGEEIGIENRGNVIVETEL